MPKGPVNLSLLETPKQSLDYLLAIHLQIKTHADNLYSAF